MYKAENFYPNVTVIGAKIHKNYMQCVIKEFETKFISVMSSIKLLLVGLREIRVICGWAWLRYERTWACPRVGLCIEFYSIL